MREGDRVQKTGNSHRHAHQLLVGFHQLVAHFHHQPERERGLLQRDHRAVELVRLPEHDLLRLGGGGLLAGSLLAAEALAPQCRVVGVEPAAGNDGQQSFKAGHVVQIPTPHTIADGAQTQALGQLNFPIIRRLADDMVTAIDEQLVESLRFFAERMKIVVEPTGALAFAGAQHGNVDIHGARVGVLISGGNVDLSRLARFLAD